MAWVKNKTFKDGTEFVKWLDKYFGSYISKHISELHVHHTWKPNHSNTQSLLQLHENMRHYHMNTRGWSDMGQHLSIGKNGDVALGRDIRIMPASAFGFNGSTNWHPFMFEMIGDFDKGQDTLSGDQFNTTMAISQYFYKKGKPIRFHREMDNRKSCPGTGITKEWYMAQVAGHKVSVSPAPNRQTESVTVKPTSSWTKVSGDWTGQTLRNGQYGIPVKQLQTKLKNKGYLTAKQVDSYFGNDTESAVRRLQKDAKLGVDGLAGKKTYDALNKKTSTKANLTVDGKWGNSTTEALQKALNTPVDGIISKQSRNSVTTSLYGNTVQYGKGGSVLIRALQRKVGAKADGLLGPATVRLLQVHLNGPVDGVLSRPSMAVKELQRRLNAGTF